MEEEKITNQPEEETVEEMENVENVEEVEPEVEETEPEEETKKVKAICLVRHINDEYLRAIEVGEEIKLTPGYAKKLKKMKLVK